MIPGSDSYLCEPRISSFFWRREHGRDVDRTAVTAFVGPVAEITQASRRFEAGASFGCVFHSLCNNSDHDRRNGCVYVHTPCGSK